MVKVVASSLLVAALTYTTLAAPTPAPEANAVSEDSADHSISRRKDDKVESASGMLNKRTPLSNGQQIKERDESRESHFHCSSNLDRLADAPS